ncbi:hypothetical protein AC578_5773 [Pseudocercospora eumusae]|uniref:JmjC domain-containing protein n=1 Tax=Pseudocercospora eumusae TaxID=321146 RepID=A0A139H543_9PEZI|nr:hypothetical protein AC578_5773 [Pseudocercospora eumusae]
MAKKSCISQTGIHRTLAMTRTMKRKRPRYDDLPDELRAQLIPESDADEDYSDSGREDVSLTSAREEPLAREESLAREEPHTSVDTSGHATSLATSDAAVKPSRRREVSLGLGDDTDVWVEDLFRIQKSQQSIEDFTLLRDRLLETHDGLIVRFQTLLEVVKVHFADDSPFEDPAWAAFQAKVKQNNDDHEPSATKGEEWRRKSLAIIIALWGPEIVEEYGIHRFGQAVMSTTKRCATKCPDFANFVPFVNAALLRRQQNAVLSAKYHRIAPDKRLIAPDVQAAFDILAGQNSSELEAAKRDHVSWTCSKLGDFRVGRKDLREWQPKVEPWLLAVDSFGLLTPRSSISPDISVRARHGMNGTSDDITVSQPAPAQDEGGASSENGYGISGQKSMMTSLQPSAPANRQQHALPKPQKPRSLPPVPRSPVPRTPSKPQQPEKPRNPLDTGSGQQNTTTGPARLQDEQLTIWDDPTPDEDDIPIEYTLHNRYHQEVQEYCREIHGESKGQRSSRYGIRAQWLTPSTRWARSWASPQLGYSGSTQELAEVLYYACGDFIKDACAGHAFTKPVVIKKEAFADSSFQSLQTFMGLLSDSHRSKEIEVQTLDETQTKRLPVKDLIAASRSRNTRKGYNALNLRDIAKSQRPLFTRLQRFRLLDMLVENARTQSGKDIESQPTDIAGCTSFNIFGLRGAFSGAHLDALGGTWVRSLDGIKLWMIVPQRDLDENAFNIRGDSWSPKGLERLILLEPDDVLLMPPGVPVVHAVHSPQPAVMAGGMLWDDLSIIPVLDLLFRVAEHQNTTNEAIAYQLPDILKSLEAVVKAETKRFCGSTTQKAFLAEFRSAVARIRSLGCDCAAIGGHCPCFAAFRRCTSLCSSHPKLPPRLPIEESGRGVHNSPQKTPRLCVCRQGTE